MLDNFTGGEEGPPPPPKAASMAVRILDMIEERGGMSARSIMRELWIMAHPRVMREFAPRNPRWWGTHLYGHYGLLHYFCRKERGVWVRRTDRPHHGRPFRTVRKGQP